MITVAQERPSKRAQFIRKTYMHLAAAVGVFVILEFLLFQIGIAGTFTNWTFGSEFRWLLVLGGFIVLGWLSRGIANSTDSITIQYIGLGIFIIAESLIFAPLLFCILLPTSPILVLFQLRLF